MWRIIPGVVFALIIAVLLFSTYQKATKTGGEELVGTPVPTLNVKAIEGLPAIPDKSVVFGQGYVLVNFFASWCTPCQAEHPYLNQLAKEYGLPIVGIAWRDSPANVTAMLNEHGNPYNYVGIDMLDTSAFSFGVEGLPESFLVDANGVIVATHRGPLMPNVIQEKLLPHLDAK